MVNLTRIYTRTGDAGTTALGDGSRVPKTDPRLAAFADADEANSSIGVALAMGNLAPDVAEVLARVQNELFDVGADLCTPVVPDPAYPPLRVRAEEIAALEADCDRFNADLPVLRSFVLPGGAPGAALLHVSRTVVRRAERSTWAALAEHGSGAPDTGTAATDTGPAPAGGVNPLAAAYLNRLSDLLFILARVAGGPAGDVLWRPGGDRQQASDQHGDDRPGLDRQLRGRR